MTSQLELYEGLKAELIRRIMLDFGWERLLQASYSTGVASNMKTYEYVTSSMELKLK